MLRALGISALVGFAFPLLPRPFRICGGSIAAPPLAVCRTALILDTRCSTATVPPISSAYRDGVGAGPKRTSYRPKTGIPPTKQFPAETTPKIQFSVRHPNYGVHSPWVP